MSEVLHLPSVSMPREEMIAFARRYDAQPFHIDEAAASATPLGGLAASGWYTLAKLGAALEARLWESGLAVAGAEQIVWLTPVRAGDSLSGRVRLDPARACACGAQARTAVLDVANARGEAVMRAMVDCVLGADDRELAARDCSLRRERPARARRHERAHPIRYFDEIEIGDELALGRHEFAVCEVEEFHLLSGIPAGAQGEHEEHGVGLVTPWHLPAAWMQAMLCIYEREAIWLRERGERVPLLGPAAGVKQFRWRRPVAVGETITFRGWAERKIEIATQRQWGLLVVGAEGLDAQGEVIVSFYPQILMERAAA